jgi:TPR repeat protein
MRGEQRACLRWPDWSRGAGGAAKAVTGYGVCQDPRVLVLRAQKRRMLEGSKSMNRHLLLSLLVIACVSFAGVAQASQLIRPSHDKQTLLTKAQQGDVRAQFWLGTGYEQGWFGKADYRKALKWLRRAAEHGDQDAQDSLGQMYEEGEGVPQSDILAAKWYRKAAEHVPDFGGAGAGRNDLGLLYLDGGRGVPKDVVRAYMWFRLAGTEVNLADAKSQMTAAQVREAEQMATEWKNSHPER